MAANLKDYLALARPILSRAVLWYYACYGTAAVLLLLSLYLLLPVLRSAGVASEPRIEYALALGPRTLAFTLAWWVPFALVAGAAWALALAKRTEYGIWRVTHEALLRRYRSLRRAGGAPAENPAPARRVEASARARAVAVRRFALLALDGTAVAVLLAVLAWAEPLAAFIVSLLAVVLIILFREGIWHRRQEESPGAGDLEQTIRHRVRLANARQLFYALMPLTVMMLLFIDRLWRGFTVELADLVFISLLVTGFGTLLANIVQHLLYLRRIDPVLLAPWPHLREGRLREAEAAFRLERAARGARPGDENGDFQY